MNKKHSHIIKDTECSNFCEQMYMAINAGLPAYQGISILMDDSRDQETHDLLQKIFEPMQTGYPLNKALRDTEVFPEYMVNMIELGENTGKLEEVLKSLATYYEREAGIKETIKYAVRYPAIIFIMMIAVIIVLITKVLPTFSQMYEQLGSGLTGSARVLMNISIFINRNLLILIFVILAVITILVIMYKAGKVSRLIEKSHIAMNIATDRFANCMYLAVASGLTTDQGLDLSLSLIINSFMTDKIRNCIDLVHNGEGFANAVYLSGIFPKMYSSWIDIAYTTGNIDGTLKQISEAYEDETNDAINRFISRLEPALVIILSVFVGLILISFILPLLGIMTNIG